MVGGAMILVLSAGLAGSASGQGLYYKEVTKDGKVFVFNSAVAYKEWQKSGQISKAITIAGQGEKGETVVAENETAIDLYNLKHDRPGYERPAAKPSAPALPTAFRIGESGELKLNGLVQAWYVTDDSPASTGTSQLGNTTGINTFRLRRAEIKLSGKFTPAWGFEVMFDPAKAPNTAAGQDGKILQDLAVSFFGLKGHEISIGQKKIFLTEEGVRSSAALDFAERSVVVRQISDRREIGLFWKADWSPLVTTWVSATTGTNANNNDDSNDTLNYVARLDLKPVKGLLAGVSGAYSGGEGLAHLGRTRLGAHLRWEGDELPLGVRFEYYMATDEQLTAGLKSDLKRDGWYGSVLYTVAKQFQLAVRYEEFNRNKDVSGNKIKILTGGLHYLIKGNNVNLKLDVESIKDDGRLVNGQLQESYVQGVLAAQVAF
jgi:hypothetical protein